MSEGNMQTHLEVAVAELSALCKGKRFTMSIPAQPDYDSDLVIGQALRDLRKLLGIVETLDKAICEAHETICHYDLVRRPNGVDWKPVEHIQSDLADRLWAAYLLLHPELKLEA